MVIFDQNGLFWKGRQARCIQGWENGRAHDPKLSKTSDFHNFELFVQKSEFSLFGKKSLSFGA